MVTVEVAMYIGEGKVLGNGRKYPGVFAFWHFVRGVWPCSVKSTMAGSLWGIKLVIVRCVSYSDV